MAYAATAPSHSYSDSDDDSEYGFDLTAEEEDLLHSLVDCASEEPEAQPVQKSGNLRRRQPATSSTAYRSYTSRRAPIAALASSPPPLASSDFQQRRQPIASTSGSSSLREDIAVAFAGHASVKLLNESTLNFNVRQTVTGTKSGYHNDPGALSHLVGTRDKVPSHLEDTDDDQKTVRANVEPRERGFAHQPARHGDISYPDLSQALNSAQSPPTPTDHTKHAKAAEESDEDEYGFKDVESPLSRFRTFPKKTFSVSDLIAGAWCELQYYYTLTKLPGGKKTRTAAMKGGSKLHKGLEDEIYTTVKVEIVKKEDAFGLRLWNIIQGLRTLRETGMTRELEVWGLVEGHVVNGVIDHLNYENPDPEFEEEIRSSQGSSSQPAATAQGPAPGGAQQKITTFFHSSAKPDHDQIYLTDVKTTGASRPPSGAAVRPAKIQLFLYHRFLSDMAAGRLDFLRVVARYGLNPDEPFSDTFVAQIGSLHDEMFEDASDMEATSGSNKESISDYKPALSSPDRGSGSSAASDLIRYRTLRELLSLLQHELQMTFPHGAESLGSLVTVEYRKRPRRSSRGEEEVEEDEEGGKIVGANVFFVDHNVLQDYLRQDLEWWEGERDPKGVDIEEAGFKCRSCEFANECEWRQQQDAEMLSRAKTRIASRGKRQAVR